MSKKRIIRISGKDLAFDSEIIGTKCISIGSELGHSVNLLKTDNYNVYIQTRISALKLEDSFNKQGILLNYSYINKKEWNKKITSKNNTRGKTGAVINMIFSFALLLFSSIFNIILIGIPFTFFFFVVFFSNYNYYLGKHNKVMAGILGLFSLNIIGSILIFWSNRN